jgi:hypothetical protein
MTKHKVTESTRTLTVQNTRVSGKTTYRTVKALKSGQMEVALRVVTNRVASMALGVTCGPMGVGTLATGSRTKSVARDAMTGLTAGVMKETGLTTTWTDRVFIPGRMEGATRVGTSRTRNTAMAVTPGQTDASIQVCGKTGGSTAQASTKQVPPTALGKEFGSMVNVKSGYDFTILF